jgi:DNA processing protein
VRPVQVTDAEVAAAALVSLPAMSPSRLRLALSEHDPEDLWGDICAGRSSVRELLARGDVEHATVVARGFNLDALSATLNVNSIQVLTPPDHRYPVALRDDIDRPPVLFARGEHSLLAGRVAAIVGTRRATAAGRATAKELAQELAAAGITVLSGLALGIDTAAHRGAMAVGSTVAVVGCGLDLCYPAQHQAIFEEICDQHLAISEWPPGTPPAPFRFPMRNRLIAALSEVVVVVESGLTGGSLITAREALDRGREVMAVPGNLQVPSSSGTNALIRDGATPITSVDDVLREFEVSSTVRISPLTTPQMKGRAIEITHELSHGSLTLDQLVQRLSVPIGEVVVAVGELLRLEIIVESNGWLELSSSMLVSGKEHP